MIRDLLHDLRYGARTLRRSPGFTLTVLLSLAIGIGANAAIFSAVNAVLLQPLPVRDPSALVALSRGVTSGVWGEPDRVIDTYSYPLYERLRTYGAEHRLFDGLAAQQSMRTGAVVRWREGEPPSEIAGARAVSANFFDVLGVHAFRGRALAAQDDRPGADPVVVLGHGYWQRRFGSNPAVLGAALTINAARYTVVGILPPGFTGAVGGDRTDLWVSLAMQAQLNRADSLLAKRSHWWLFVIGRLAPGTTAPTAQAGANVALQQFLAQDRWRMSELVDPDPNVPRTAKDVRIELNAGSRGFAGIRQTLREPLLVLMAGVALLLLIVCLNVGHLMLARAFNRQREMSIRAALGAGRARLVRQLLAEGLLLSLMGGLAGVLAMRWILDGLLALAPGGPTLEVQPDLAVWGFTGALTIGTAVLLALLPAWHASRVGLQQVLAANTQTVTQGRPRRLVSRALLISQVALSVVLLVGAGLLARSLARLRAVDNGFDREHVLVANVLPRELGLTTPQSLVLYQELVDRAAALPGVRAAAMSGLGGSFLLVRPEDASSTTTMGHKATATPGHFDAVGLSVRQGRGFDQRDHAKAPAVAIINETLARRLFAGTPAVGRRFRVVAEPASDITVVGVVGDARIFNLRDVPPPVFYRPVAQTPIFLRRLEVRSYGNPALLADALRRAIGEVSPNLPVSWVRTMRTQVEGGLAQERLMATLASYFGLTALFLVAVGLYGVIAQWTSQRTQEIGVRMALGATAGKVRWMVLRQAFALVLAGVALGVPAALAASRSLKGLLFGIAPTDPATVALAALAMFAVATAAAYLPARRASRVDPMDALRAQ